MNDDDEWVSRREMAQHEPSRRQVCPPRASAPQHCLDRSGRQVLTDDVLDKPGCDELVEGLVDVWDVVGRHVRRQADEREHRRRPEAPPELRTPLELSQCRYVGVQV